MRDPQVLVELFRTRGLRITPQRQEIFRNLAGVNRHTTAEAVWDEVRAHLPAISLKTVYETLHELVELGELQRIDIGGGAARFDTNAVQHHHLVCDRCGAIRDLHADYSSLAIPHGESQGFEVTNAEVIFRGLCGECAGKATS
jgi:Fe2+ or Zn2+ uptake regulation protein